ncbi:MAG: AGE family epimerase/isomerase [Chthonomonadales bacterium]|nr:AGE family epimerase/isomerase [Chthonomonadales bacterium]
MTPRSEQELLAAYRDGLLTDTLPFWIPRAIDRECGGYLTALGRDGAVLQTDKAVWVQGRFAWLLATLHRTVEPRQEWLDLARHGIDFLQTHCFDADGRMFFWVTRDGRPLRKRRYLFSECFAAIAMAAYGAVAGDDGCRARAIELLRLVLRYHTDPALAQPKVDPATRPMKGLAMPMILLVTAQELRGAGDDALCDRVVEESIAEIERDFAKPDLGCVLETVGPAGEFHDTFEGRMVCPGHSIEAGWFILEESRRRGGDARLTELGTRIVDWSLRIGWDAEHGGILYYRDARGLPGAEYWHDMKFWWPHNEAIIATLLAHRLTGDARYARWHAMVHDWAYAHFPDALHGEWYGYLHRDGSVSTPLKGNMWKGPFHLPRMQWYCWQLLERGSGAGAW